MALNLPNHEISTIASRVTAEQLAAALTLLFGTDGGGVESDRNGGLKSNPAAGATVALSSPPTTLTANADTTLTFATPVRHVLVQNNTATDKHVNFDAAASLGTLLVAAGVLMAFDVPCTTLHVWSTAADNVNGATASNLVALGWS